MHTTSWISALLLGTLLLPTIARARIGETMQECDRRYGKPTNVQARSLATNALEATYVKDGFTILVLFVDGRAEEIRYSHASALSDAQVMKLLNNNLHGETWNPTPSGSSRIYGSWETASGAKAEYFKPQPWEPLAAAQSCLEIRSGKLVHLLEQREAARRQQEERKAEATTQKVEAAKQKAEAAKQEEERQRLKRLDNF